MSKAKDLDKIREMFRTGDYVNFPIKHCILEWAQNLSTPDCPPWDKVGKYKVNCVISEDVAEEMRYCGFKVEKNKDGQSFLIPTRVSTLGAPEVVDTDGNPVDCSKIGNGSIATVNASCRYYKIGGKEHLKLYLNKVTVEDLVPYEAGTAVADPF